MKIIDITFRHQPFRVFLHQSNFSTSNIMSRKNRVEGSRVRHEKRAVHQNLGRNNGFSALGFKKYS